MGAGFPNIGSSSIGDPIGKAVVEIIADDKAYQKGLSKSRKDLQTFDREAERITRNVSRNFALAGGAMAAGLGVAVARFTEFERSMKNVQAVAGATGEEYVKLKDFALEMGSQTVFSAREAGEAMYFLASAGQEVGEQMKTTASVLDLAAATQSGLAESAEIIVNSLSAFQLQADQSRRVADVFAESISSSQANLGKLRMALPQTATVFNDLNQSIEANVAALSLLFDRGVRAETAATGLRNNLLTLLDPTTEARIALDDLGLSVEELNPTMNSLVDIVQKLETAGFDTADSVRIFGKESNALAILASTGADKLRDFEQSLIGASGAAETMKDIQLDSLAGDLQLLKSAAEGAAIAFGEGLSPAVRTAAEEITMLISAFNALPGPVKSALSIATASAVGLLGTLGLIGLAVPKISLGFKILSSELPLLSTRLGLVGLKLTALATSPAAIAIGAITATVGGFVGGLKLLKDAIEDDEKALRSVNDEMERQRSNVAKIQRGIDGWKKELEFLNGGLKDGATNIQRLDEATGQWIDTPIAERIEFVEGKIANLNKELRIAGGDFRTATERMKDMKPELMALQKGLGELFDSLKRSARAFGLITDEVEEDWEKVLESFNEGTTEYANYYDLLTDSFRGWTSITGEGYRASTAAQATYLDELLESVDKESEAWRGLYNLREDLRQEDIKDAIAKGKERNKVIKGQLEEEHRQLLAEAEAYNAQLLTIHEDGLKERRKLLDKDLKEPPGVPEIEPKEVIFFQDLVPEEIAPGIREIESVVEKTVDTSNRLMGESTDQQINAAESVAGTAINTAEKIVTANERAAEEVARAWRRTRNDIKGAFEGLFESLFREGKPAWEQFWEDLKNIAIRKLSQIAAEETIGRLLDRLAGQRTAGGTVGGTVGDVAIAKTTGSVFDKIFGSRTAVAAAAGTGTAAAGGTGIALLPAGAAPTPAVAATTAAASVALPVIAIGAQVVQGYKVISSYLKHRELQEQVRSGELLVERRRQNRRDMFSAHRPRALGGEERLNKAAEARDTFIRIDRLELNMPPTISEMSRAELDRQTSRQIDSVARAFERNPAARRRAMRR
jgi:TP901 family phage tail tape measure protein